MREGHEGETGGRDRRKGQKGDGRDRRGTCEQYARRERMGRSFRPSLLSLPLVPLSCPFFLCLSLVSPFSLLCENWSAEAQAYMPIYVHVPMHMDMKLYTRACEHTQNLTTNKTSRQ